MANYLTDTSTNLNNISQSTGVSTNALTKIPDNIPASTFTNAPASLTIPSIPTPQVPDIKSDSALEQAKQYVAQIQPQQSQAEKDRSTFVQQYKDLLGGPTKESETAQLYKDTGINDIVAKINDYTAQITAIDDLNEANKLSIGQNVGGVTVTGIQNEEARMNRESAIKKLNISASLAAVQGKFNTAKSLVDQAITVKYADQQAKIDRVRAFLDLNKDDLAKEDKKQSQILVERQRILDNQKANDKAIGDMVINASSANAPTALIEKARLAKSPAEAAMILKQYAGDYYKTELLKTQIETEKVQRAKMYADIAKTKAETSETYNKIRVANTKIDAVNQTGRAVKVSNAEITDLNDAVRAKNSVESLITQFKDNIKTNGTQVLFGKAAGERNALKTNLLLELKTLAKTGALDQGTIDVLSGTIPNNEFFASESAQTASLNSLLTTVKNKSDEYVKSYRGTTAEIDPRTIRAFKFSEDDVANNILNTLNVVDTKLQQGGSSEDLIKTMYGTK